MSNVLVTGSGGGLGKFVVTEMKKQGHAVCQVFHSGLEQITEYGFHGDLKNKTFVENMFKNHVFDFVVHCAGRWNGFNSDMSIAHDNSVMMMNLLEAVSGIKKFIFVSSSAADLNNPYPLSSYGYSKLFSEQLLQLVAKDKGFSYTIWRPFHIISPEEKYSPGSSHICTNLFHRHTILKEKINLSNMPKKRDISFIWAEDVAECIASFMQNPCSDGEIFNLGSANLRSPYDVAFHMLTLLDGDEITEKQCDDKEDDRFIRSYGILDWKPRTGFNECIKKFVQYKRSKHDFRSR